MARLKIDLRTFDIGAPVPNAEAFVDRVVSQVEESWKSGADLVLLPEFLWLGLEQFVKGRGATRAVAGLFWAGLWPGLSRRLARKGKAVVLGTVPFIDARGRLLNRAPILADGRRLHQDKLHLTPWEKAFTPGDGVRLWKFKGARIAVVTCLDIEVPEIAAALRGKAVDVVLVPSATETVLGVERVGRAADARAGARCSQVGVSHLVGRARSELVDDNVGRAAFFSPSQSAFAGAFRHLSVPVVRRGDHVLSVGADLAALRRARAARAETNPARLRAGRVRVLS
ncbi:MAG: nitrilase-related carbon-nitrogen hydrolase [Verrucomicrobiota bacterium]